MASYLEAQQKIIRNFNEMSGEYNVGTIFNDFITMAAYAISNTVDEAQWEEREEAYLAIAKKYRKEYLGKVSEMIYLTELGLKHGFGDFLGEIYMQLEISNSHVGQFFTPYEISKIMADLVDAEKTSDGLIRLNEPSVGSGGAIVAYAESMSKNGINYRENLRVICNDLDFGVVKMCYVQLSLMGIDAIVMQGDTLTKEIGEYWYTPAHMFNKTKNYENRKRMEADEKVQRMKGIINQTKQTSRPKEVHVDLDVAEGQTDIFEFI